MAIGSPISWFLMFITCNRPTNAGRPRASLTEREVLLCDQGRVDVFEQDRSIRPGDVVSNAYILTYDRSNSRCRSPRFEVAPSSENISADLE